MLKQRQLTLKQKGFIMLEHSLVALVATFYVLIVFNCFCSIHLLFCFCVFFFFRIFWAYSFWFNFWYFIEEFSRAFLSMRVNNQLWHARIGLFNNRLSKRNKTVFPLYLSNDLSKRLTCIISLNLRSAYWLCNFLQILVVLHCLNIKNFLLLKAGDIESNPGPRRVQRLSFAIGI